MADEPQPKPKRRKRRKKKRKKRPRPDAESARPERNASAEAADEPEGEASEEERAPSSGDGESRRGRYLWVLLVTVALVELWAFGSRGHIEVCVAKEGVHDFALVGQERNNENTRRYPTCEKRLNIGIRSSFDEMKEQAMVRACHRANILAGRHVRDATLVCAIEKDGWKHRTTVENCPPWHDHYYRRMLWFLYDE